MTNDEIKTEAIKKVAIMTPLIALTHQAVLLAIPKKMIVDCVSELYDELSNVYQPNKKTPLSTACQCGLAIYDRQIKKAKENDK